MNAAACATYACQLGNFCLSWISLNGKPRPADKRAVAFITGMVEYRYG
jgi:hypothetical protein